MARIFLSHSSVDEREAVALNKWLTDNGWDDVFLDIDPQRGLVAGERCQEALRQAADRCEAVIFIVSPAWAKSNGVSLNSFSPRVCTSKSSESSLKTFRSESCLPR